MNAPDMSVDFCGIKFKNPVVTASGTYGFGREYNEFVPLSKLGGISVKGLTLLPRDGNKPPRIAETPSGILNSVGLQNPGIHAFIEKELPFLKKQNLAIIANISGNTVEDYMEMTEIASDSDVDLLEINISCPNVKSGGMAFGTSTSSVEQITRAVKSKAKKPVMIKLSPNVTDIAEIARAAEAAGADALSLINTLLGMRINIKTRKPILANNMGGLSGPAVLPIAVRMIWQVRNAVSLPFCGMGGVATWENAVELMLAGASLVAVGTACFTDPHTPEKVIDGLYSYAKDSGIERITDIVGTAVMN